MKNFINEFFKSIVLAAGGLVFSGLTWLGNIIQKSDFWNNILSPIQRNLLIGFIIVFVIVAVFLFIKKIIDNRKYNYDIFLSYRTS